MSPRHALLAPLLALAALSSGCGEPFLGAQLDVPKVRIVEPSVSFDPALATSVDFCDLVSTGCVFHDLTYDLGAEIPLFDEKGMAFDVRLIDVDVHFSGADLSAIRSMRLLLPDGQGGYTPISSYDGTSAPTGDIYASGNSDLDLGPYFSKGKLDVRFELDYDPSGTLAPFTADVGLELSVVVTADEQQLF